MTEVVIPFERLGMHDVETVGGKNASIGEMIGALSKLGVKVPGGFATTADAYRRLLAQGGLDERIRLALGTHTEARIFRNQVGSLPDPRTGRLVTFGLARGSADLIGWRTITITPEMVGQRVAIFTSIEVKTITGHLTPAQQAWMGTVRTAGGIAGVARSVRDAEEILG